MFWAAGSRVPWRSLNASRWTSVVLSLSALLSKLTDTASDRDRAPEMVTASDDPELGAATGATSTTPRARTVSPTCTTEPLLNLCLMPRSSGQRPPWRAHASTSLDRAHHLAEATLRDLPVAARRPPPGGIRTHVAAVGCRPMGQVVGDEAVASGPASEESPVPAGTGIRRDRGVGVVLLVVVLAAAARPVVNDLLDRPGVAQWATIFVAIAVQAMPFLVLGVTISAVIAAFVSADPHPAPVAGPRDVRGPGRGRSGRCAARLRVRLGADRRPARVSGRRPGRGPGVPALRAGDQPGRDGLDRRGLPRPPRGRRGRFLASSWRRWSWVWSGPGSAGTSCSRGSGGGSTSTKARGCGSSCSRRSTTCSAPGAS